jgi:excisionase family DNA binding protein
MNAGPYVPIEELAKHFSVSISTIRMWVRNGHIPKDTYVNIGNTYRFSIDDVASALTKSNANKEDSDDDVGENVVDFKPAMAGFSQPDIDDDM